MYKYKDINCFRKVSEITLDIKKLLPFCYCFPYSVALKIAIHAQTISNYAFAFLVIFCFTSFTTIIKYRYKLKQNITRTFPRYFKEICRCSCYILSQSRHVPQPCTRLYVVPPNCFSHKFPTYCYIVC